MKIEFGKKAQIIIALLLLTGAAGAIAEYGNNINIPGNFTGMNGIFSGDISANDITVSGTVDGVDIALSINQGVRTTDSPTFIGLNATDINADKIGGVLYADKYATIQDAYNDSTDGDKIIVPKGTYSTELNIIQKNIIIEGVGSETILQASGTNPVIFIDAGNVNAVNSPYRVSVRNLKIVGGGSGNSNAHGIKLNNTAGTEIESVEIVNSRNAIDITGAWLVKLNKVLIDTQDGNPSYTGIYSHVPVASTDTALILSDTTIRNSLSYGVRMEHFSGTTINNVQSMGTGNDAYYFGNPQSTTPTQFLHMSNVLADTVTGNCYTFDGTNSTSGVAEEIGISNLWAGSCSLDGIRGINLYNTAISNILISTVTNPVNLTGGARVIIANGYIQGYSGRIKVNDTVYSTITGLNLVAGGGGLGIAEAGSSNNNQISNNVLDASGSVPVKIGGNSVFRDNVGVSPFDFGNSASAPTAYGAGDKYYDTDVNYHCFYNGSAWVDISTGLVICS